MEELLTPAELRAKLKISRTLYEKYLTEGMPGIPLSDKPKAHRRFDYDEVVEWLRNRHSKEAP